MIQGGANDLAGLTGPATQPMIAENIMSMVDLARANGIRHLKGRMYEYRTLTSGVPAVPPPPSRLFRLSSVMTEFALTHDGKRVVLALPERVGDSAAFRFQVSPVDSDAPVPVGPPFPSGTTWRVRHDGAGVLLVQSGGGSMRWATMDLSSGQVTRWHEVAPATGSLVDLVDGVLWISADGLRLSRFDSLGNENRVPGWPPVGVRAFYAATAPNGGAVAVVGFSDPEHALTMHVLTLPESSLRRVGHLSYDENIWWQEPITLQAFRALLEVRRWLGPAEHRLDALARRVGTRRTARGTGVCAVRGVLRRSRMVAHESARRRDEREGTDQLLGAISRRRQGVASARPPGRLLVLRHGAHQGGRLPGGGRCNMEHRLGRAAPRRACHSAAAVARRGDGRPEIIEVHIKVLGAGKLLFAWKDGSRWSNIVRDDSTSATQAVKDFRSGAR